MNSKFKTQNSKLPGSVGFTLIEMVLAVSIFAMIIGVVFSSLRVGIGSWEKGERDIELYQRWRSVTDILYREINSAYPYTLTPGVLDTSKKFYAFFGKSDSLKFVSYAKLHQRAGGLSLLDVWVEEGKGLMLGEGPALASNLPDLEDVPLRDEKNSLVLCPGVKNIQFRYLDRKDRNEEGDWDERWDPKDKTGRRLRLPQFVEITLTVVDRSEEEQKQRLIVPIMGTGKPI